MCQKPPKLHRRALIVTPYKLWTLGAFVPRLYLWKLGGLLCPSPRPSARNQTYLAQVEKFFKVGELIFQTVSLPFDMEAQTQTNWCWAATAKSVSHYFFKRSTWDAIKIASAELGLTCCVSPVPSACNVSWFLDRALTRTQNFVSIRTGTLSYDEIRAEILAGRPVGAQIGWSGGGGHFMVIYGCSRIAGTIYLDIDDPIYGKSNPTLSTFTNSYQGSGS